jgi:hypothetical protein
MNYSDYYRPPQGPRSRPQYQFQPNVQFNQYPGGQFQRYYQQYGQQLGTMGPGQRFDYPGGGGQGPLRYASQNPQGGYNYHGYVPGTAPSPFANFGMGGQYGGGYSQAPAGYRRPGQNGYNNQPTVYDNRGAGYTNF